MTDGFEHAVCVAICPAIVPLSACITKSWCAVPACVSVNPTKLSARAARDRKQRKLDFAFQVLEKKNKAYFLLLLC